MSVSPTPRNHGNGALAAASLAPGSVVCRYPPRPAGQGPSRRLGRTLTGNRERGARGVRPERRAPPAPRSLPSTPQPNIPINIVPFLQNAACFAEIAPITCAPLQDSRNRVEAIVMAEELRAMDAPGNGGTELFSIHEGTKVRIDQTSNGWVEIVLSDGKIGWVSLDGIELI